MITRTLITVATTARLGMVIYMVMTMTMTTTTATITITRTITNVLVKITVMNVVEKNAIYLTISVLFRLSVSAPVYLISGCLCHSTHQPEQRATNGFDTTLRAGHQVSRL